MPLFNMVQVFPDNRIRRYLLTAGVKAGAALLAGALLPTGRVWAAAPGSHNGALSARSLAEALQSLDIQDMRETREIVITAPDIAENGARVDIEVSTTLPEAKSLAVFADKNPFPFCAALAFSPNLLPYARMQIKLAESSRIRAIIRTADGKQHVAIRDIRVTLGSCGGG